MKKLRVASMFAGIGGICLGFKNAGAKIVWANEIDKNACITYRHNLGNVYLVEDDIKNISEYDIPDMDILTAGFPCQAFSVAGYRKGFQDERGNLFFEVMRVVACKKPRIVFLENVKNLLTHDNGNTYRVIESSLKEQGYEVKKYVLNTMEYGNIPQNRERIYIIAFNNKNDAENFKELKPLKLEKTIHSIIKKNDKKDSKYYYNKTKYYDKLKELMTKSDTIYQWRRIYLRENKSNVCPTLTANMGTGGHNVPLVKDDYDIRKLTPEECLLFQGFPSSYKFPSNISMGSCYKQAGNSVSVPVIERLAKSIINAINTTEKEEVHV